MKDQIPKIGHTHNIKITVVSPVSIGDGKVLSPLSDYILHEGKLHYINHQLFEKALEQRMINSGDSSIIDDYINTVSQNTNEQKGATVLLKEFIENKLDHHFQDLVNKTAIDVYGVKNAVQMQSIIKNAGNPYISGSSLKGAIRTALLYDWLMETKEGHKELKNICEFIEKIYPSFAQYKKEWAWLDNEKKEKKKLPKASYDMWKELGKKLGSYKQKIVEYEAFLFKNINEENSSMPNGQAIRIADTQPVQVNRITAYQAKRIRLKRRYGKKTKNEQPLSIKETLETGTELFTEWHVVTEVINMANQKCLKNENIKALMKVLNQFSMDCIQSELVELDNIKDMPNKKYQKQLISFYENLEDKICRGICLLRIGSGKTYFDNSLALAIANADDLVHPRKDERSEESTTLHTFLKFIAILFNVEPKKENVFPVTRTILNKNGTAIPPGWIKIEVV